MQVIPCSWCRRNNSEEALLCGSCGAPLDQKDRVSDSGWREAPRLKDMEEFRFSDSVLQVEGKYVPVGEITLSPSDSVYFESHVLLWKDLNLPLDQVRLAGNRRARGMPYSVLATRGAGRLAVSRDAPGELVVMPLGPGVELDVRGHAFLLASHSVDYSFVRIKGLVNLLYGGNGMYLDRFVSRDDHGVLLLHGNGDVLQRTLAQGERILVEPGAFLYKDASVTMNTVPIPGVSLSMLGRKLYMAEMVGPGRVGIQSMYHHHETD